MHEWCGLGKALKAEGAETDLIEGRQETVPAGTEGQFVPHDNTLGLGALGRRVWLAPAAVPEMSKGLV